MSTLDIARMITNNSTSTPVTTSTRYGKAVASASPGGTVSVLMDGSDTPVELVTKTAVDKDERVSVVNDGGVYSVLAMESVSDGLVENYDAEIPIDPKTGESVPTETQHSRIKNVVLVFEAIAQILLTVKSQSNQLLGYLKLGWRESGGGTAEARIGCGGTSLGIYDGKFEMQGKAAASIPYNIIGTAGATGSVSAKRHAGMVILTFDTYRLPQPPGVGKYEITVPSTETSSGNRLLPGWLPKNRCKTVMMTTEPYPVQVLVEPDGGVYLFHADAGYNAEISGTITWFAEN